MMYKEELSARAGPLGPDTSIQMSKIFVDAHVHIHQCFHLPTFFDSAIANFQAASNSNELENPDEQQCFILLLTESTPQNSYRHLSDLAAAGQCLSSHNGLIWSFHHTSEEGGLRALRSDGHSVFLVAGRQIITAEKLEVLGLLTPTVFEDHQPLSQTVQEVRNAGGLPVIPWGVGKWMGKRGRILKRFLATHESPIFLGDNSGRPFFWPRPRLFSFAEEGGGHILPGSDPLPFPAEVTRAGSYGFTMDAQISSYLIRDFKKALLNPKSSIEVYGHRERALRFIKNQVRIRSTAVVES
jgi:hypothetical protein